MGRRDLQSFWSEHKEQAREAEAAGLDVLAALVGGPESEK